MNWLLIVVLVIMIGLALNGYRKGFIRILISFLSIIVTLILVGLITPYVGDFLKNHTPVYDNIKNSITETVVDLTGEEPDDSGSEGYVPGIIQKFLEGQDRANAAPPADASDAAQTETSGLEDYIGSHLAAVIVNLIAYIAAFIIITLVLRFTLFTFDFIANLPVLKGINKLAGLLLGAAEGLLVVWILFLIITVLAATDMGQMLFKLIGDSKVLSFLYDQNFLLKIIMGRI